MARKKKTVPAVDAPTITYTSKDLRAHAERLLMPVDPTGIPPQLAFDIGKAAGMMEVAAHQLAVIQARLTKIHRIASDGEDHANNHARTVEASMFAQIKRASRP